MTHVSMTPEKGLRFGKVLGEIENGRVGIGSDGGNMSKIIIELIKTGVMISGGMIYDFGDVNLPIIRSGIRLYKPSYGLYVFEDQENNNTINISILNKDGIELMGDEVTDIIKKLDAVDFSDWGTNMGSQKKLTEYKTFYLRTILNSIKSDQFNINFGLTTKSKIVSEVLNELLSELYSKIKPDSSKNYEFRGEIINNGDEILLYKSDGTQLTREQVLSVMVYVMLKDSNVGMFIFPDYVSKTTEEAVLKLGGSVIRTGEDRSERMNKILNNGSEEQLLIEFDGIYAAVRILDFLNKYNISFDSLVDNLPNVFRAEAQIECEENKIIDAIMDIKNRYKSEKLKEEKGIRIETGSGIAFILPSNSKGIIKIVSEAESMEAAEEISASLIDRIRESTE